MARSTLKRTWPSGLKLCLLKPGLSHCQCSVRLSARTRPARNLVAVLFLCTLIDIVYESTLHAFSTHSYTRTRYYSQRRRAPLLARSLARKHTQTHLCSHIGLTRWKTRSECRRSRIVGNIGGSSAQDVDIRAMVLGGSRRLGDSDYRKIK